MKREGIIQISVLPAWKLPQAPPLNIVVEGEGIDPNRKRPLPGSGLVDKKILRGYGTIRCHSGTHMAATCLTGRGYHECPNAIYFSREYKRRMMKLGAKRKRIVNPQFGEWLMGFELDWTAAALCLLTPDGLPEHVRHNAGCELSPAGLKKLQGISLFTGVAGLEKGVQDWVMTTHYCEKDEKAT